MMRLPILGLWLLAWACTAPPAEQGTQTATAAENKENFAKEAHAGVFAPWDGHWRGTFFMYQDTSQRDTGQAQPRISSREALQARPLQLTDSLKVEQFYASENPFYQTVRILDTYREADGSLRQVESTGYNAVTDTGLVCVVNKPDEQVVHQGSSPDSAILIWARDLRDPLKIEYFYEEVLGDTYYIAGWGYYGGDDPARPPKLWFYAEYERVE
jgi:hypothetical protein